MTQTLAGISLAPWFLGKVIWNTHVHDVGKSNASPTLREVPWNLIFPQTLLFLGSHLWACYLDSDLIHWFQHTHIIHIYIFSMNKVDLTDVCFAYPKWIRNPILDNLS